MPDKCIFRVDPHSATVRFFKTPIKQLPLHLMATTTTKWYKSLTLIFSDTGDVRVTASETAPTITELKALAKYLKQLGYTTFSYNHNAKPRKHPL